ncbi:MAG: hypothetical protein CFK52_10455 [Chloracidobacterium sp. CP2_5A]|nr:MAG: hypothetical protein CFK52_10455 [Chloracidobacterium sp. CP2_5A]
MIFYLAAWAVLLALCLAVGASALTFFSQLDAFERPADRCLAMAWIGLLTLTNAFLALSLILPLRPRWCALTALGLSLPALVLLKARRAARECWTFARWPILAGGGLLALSLAWLVLRGTLLEDARIYHIPRVRWFSEYGTVCGLALLEPHLALTTAWHTLTAAFDAGLARGRVYALANGFACTLFGLNFMLVGWRLTRGTMRLSDWFLGVASLVYLSICLRSYSQIVFSPSPDIIVVFVVVMTCWLLLAGSADSERGDRGFHPALLCVAGAVSLKLFTAPLAAIVALAEAWRRRDSARSLAFLAFVLALYAGPFFAVQFISSGYAFYPLTLFDLQVGWAVDPATAEDKAKLPALTVALGFYPDGNSSVPTSWSEMGWRWLRNQTYFIFFSVINLASAGFLIFIRSVKGAILLVAAVGLIGNVFVLASAPDARYGLGYLHIGTSLLLALLLHARADQGERFLRDRFSASLASIFLLLIALRFLPFRWSTGILIAGFVTSAGLLAFFLGKALSRRRFFAPQPTWAPLTTAVVLASCIAATGCAKDATEMAIESYAAAGLLNAPDNSVPKWLLPPPTLPFHLVVKSEMDVRPINVRLERKSLAGVTYLYPVAGFCGDAELPCGSYGVRSDLRPRDLRRGLAAGFARAR